jgi:outer membrane receptor for ferric coprogen and ferric-rhodotorulic acid
MSYIEKKTELERNPATTVNVEAAVEQPDGYRATATRVGKVLQDPHDIPQAVTTVTNSLMEEQQVGSACARRCATSPACRSTPPRAVARATT